MALDPDPTGGMNPSMRASMATVSSALWRAPLTRNGTEHFTTIKKCVSN